MAAAYLQPQRAREAKMAADMGIRAAPAGARAVAVSTHPADGNQVVVPLSRAQRLRADSVRHD